ncbi:hypothetical protein UlMin_027785 [Ulmus minor]
MKKVKKGNVTIKLWDMGGQPRFRSMWERYCRVVSTIVYIVDVVDYKKLSISKSELCELLSKPSLNGIPLGLRSISNKEVCCFMISCKNSTKIDAVIDWLVKHSKSKN